MRIFAPSAGVEDNSAPQAVSQTTHAVSSLPEKPENSCGVGLLSVEAFLVVAKGPKAVATVMSGKTTHLCEPCVAWVHCCCARINGSCCRRFENEPFMHQQRFSRSEHQRHPNDGEVFFRYIRRVMPEWQHFA